ncbi:MSC_0623 family F1-like ATPase-associated protein [Mesomycoplasma molare]|uniref:DUF2714 domain-containing protein n=1 Tax=Mesomycoplasma molare TaxID=171288 RepID=A0ABY5TT58_9BACT|nr:DUF2714 domain-containing protein [Mesomycoplasma molare]UWD33872.1 DUF2714 domain-containing protein [Mesomycoplasma molare]
MITNIFKFKKRKKETKENPLLFPFYDIYKNFNETIKKENFISYERLMSSVLIKVGLGFESKEYKEYKKKIQSSISKKEDIKFEFTIISFNVDRKFGDKFLVPIVNDKISSNVDSIDLTKSKEENENNMLKILNEDVLSLIKEGKYIEIFEGLILFHSKQANSLKLFFKEEFISQIRK